MVWATGVVAPWGFPREHSLSLVVNGSLARFCFLDNIHDFRGANDYDGLWQILTDSG